MLLETSKLRLDGLHVIGEAFGGLLAALPVLHARKQLLLAISLHPPEHGVGDADDKEYNEEGAEGGETLRILLEAGRETKEQERNKEEHDQDVDKGEALPNAGDLA